MFVIVLIGMAMVGSLALPALAGETKAKMEKAKGEMKADFQETKGEAKALKRGYKGA